MRSALLCLLGTAGAAQAQIPAGFYDRPLVTQLSGPTCMDFAPDGRIFIGQKTGAIRIYKNGATIFTPFMTVACTSNSERGVLGLALDPDFATNRWVYIYYTTSAASLNPPPTPKNRVSRFTANGDMVQPGSEVILLDLIPSDAGNHNAGCIRFGQDGKLWITTGDGGQNKNNGQNLNTLASKLLRINKDGGIPDDNPFIGQANVRTETWAYGFRNPFRFSFRPGTTIPYIGDVGAVTWEEVNVGVAGGNFGWPTAEGVSSNPAFVDPIHAYSHNGQSMSITGGVFGDSPRFPASYASRYIFADYVLDTAYYLDVNASNQLIQQGTWGPISGPVDFAMGPGGALYYAAIELSQIRKITYEPRPVSLSLPSNVYGGNSSAGSVTLDVIAPAAGQTVNIDSNNPALTANAAVVPSNLKTGSFSFTTTGVVSDTSVTVTATCFGTSVSKTLIVKKNDLKGLYVASTNLTGLQTIRSYAGLFAPAASSTVVTFTSDNPALAAPATGTVATGAVSVGVPVTAGDVTVASNATLTASLNGVQKSKTFTITPNDLERIEANPNPIHGGASGTGTVHLRFPAPVGGAIVAISDNTSLIGTPSSATVPAGATQVDFIFTTVDITVDAVRTMSAKYKGVTRTVTITITK